MRQGMVTEYKFYGTDNSNKMEKILSIKTYDNFPDAAYITVKYINHGQRGFACN